jgi:hypothetical protein
MVKKNYEKMPAITNHLEMRMKITERAGVAVHACNPST